MNIEFTLQIWKEGNQFVAHAMPLDVMSSGFTPEAARKALEEAAHLFLETADGMGTLDDILRETGYEKNGGKENNDSHTNIDDIFKIAPTGLHNIARGNTPGVRLKRN